jgi:thiamine biosynthesis protein ThiS
MNITLNGEKKNVPDAVTVQGLLEFLSIQHQRVAVELNLEIVKKDSYGSEALKEGDSVEIVSFMGGGQISSEYNVQSTE